VTVRAQAGAIPTAQSRLVSSRWTRGQALAALILVLPGLAWFATFAVYPLLSSLWMSLHQVSLVGPWRWHGLANYLQVFDDPINSIALRNTLVYAALSVPAQIVLGFLAASLVDMKVRFRVFFRLVYYLPVISSWVVVSLIFQFLFHSHGLVNYVLADGLGLLPSGYPWLTRPWSALIAIAILGVWKGIGWSMLIYLAALQSVPDEIKDAARIDGASGWQTLRWVTFPLLSRTTLFLVVLLTIGAFQSFIQFYIITGGGPANQTQVFLTYMYRQAFTFLDFGYAAAISWTLTALILVIAFIQMRFVREAYEY
jgi:multiple sugar transport system permease protein